MAGDAQFVVCGYGSAVEIRIGLIVRKAICEGLDEINGARMRGRVYASHSLMRSMFVYDDLGGSGSITKDL